MARDLDNQTVTVRLPREAVKKIKQIIDGENGASVSQWCRAKILKALKGIKI